MHRKKGSGFTLIELSVVLVIIGLVVGGILVGQDLIRSAEICATLTQLEKYNTAVRTFQGNTAPFRATWTEIDLLPFLVGEPTFKDAWRPYRFRHSLHLCSETVSPGRCRIDVYERIDSRRASRQSDTRNLP